MARPAVCRRRRAGYKLASVTFRPRLSRRSVAGTCVLAGIVLLQVASQYLSNPDARRSWSVLLFLGLEMPPLMLVLSAIFARAQRRERSMGLMVPAGLLCAGAIGAAFGAGFWVLSALLPELGLRLFSFSEMAPLRCALFGFTQGLGHFGLWTLAFALPARWTTRACARSKPTSCGSKPIACAQPRSWPDCARNSSRTSCSTR